MAEQHNPTDYPPIVSERVGTKNSLSLDEWHQWSKETIVYNLIPLALVFVQTLQSSYMAHGGLPNSTDLLIAVGAIYGAVLAALTNLLGKYKGGV